MKLHKFRWSKVYESSEEELVDMLEDKGITASRHHINELADFDNFSFNKDTTWWCADGSMMLTFGDDKLSLQAGDYVNIPRGYPFTAVAGITGCTYYSLNN